MHWIRSTTVKQPAKTMHQESNYQNRIVWKLRRFEFRSSKLFSTVVVVFDVISVCYACPSVSRWVNLKNVKKSWCIWLNMMKCECHQRKKNYLMFNFLDSYNSHGSMYKYTYLFLIPTVCCSERDSKYNPYHISSSELFKV